MSSNENKSSQSSNSDGPRGGISGMMNYILHLGQAKVKSNKSEKNKIRFFLKNRFNKLILILADVSNRLGAERRSRSREHSRSHVPNGHDGVCRAAIVDFSRSNQVRRMVN